MTKWCEKMATMTVISLIVIELKWAASFLVGGGGGDEMGVRLLFRGAGPEFKSEEES